MNEGSGHIIIMASGFIQIMDGPGFLITIGVGLPFTMAAGCMIMHMDGCGYLVINGHLPGFAGEATTIIMAGLQWGRVLILTSALVPGYLTIIGRLFLAVILTIPRVNNYYINRQKNTTIINNTTVVNNTNITQNKTVYVIGPSATQVEKATNEKLRPAKIVQKTTPGNTKISGSTVTIYKPAVRETPQQNSQIKPSKIVNLNELRGAEGKSRGRAK